MNGIAAVLKRGFSEEGLDFYPATQFSLFRILLGAYLVFHFSTTLHFVSDFDWSRSMYPVPPEMLLWLGIVTSLAFMVGFQRKFAAALAFVAIGVLIRGNLFYFGVNHDYAGWLLLFTLAVPKGEPWSVGTKVPNWKMPAYLFTGAWIVLALTITASGVNKIPFDLNQIGFGSEWFLGDTTRHIFAVSSFYNSQAFANLLNGYPDVGKLLTYLALMIETFFGVMCFWRPTRILGYVGMSAILFAIVTDTIMAEVAIPVVCFMVLVFDLRWVRRAAIRA